MLRSSTRPVMEFRVLGPLEVRRRGRRAAGRAQAADAARDAAAAREPGVAHEGLIEGCGPGSAGDGARDLKSTSRGCEGAGSETSSSRRRPATSSVSIRRLDCAGSSVWSPRRGAGAPTRPSYARRSRSGADRRSPSSRTSRGRDRERPARGAPPGCARGADRRRARAGRHARARRRARAAGRRASTIASACAASSCSPSTAPAGRPTRWPPTARRGALVEELGLEPGAELRRLEREILGQEPRSSRRRAPPAGAAVRLPASRRRSSAARRELGEIRSCSTGADVRLVTLTGPGGTGKTRLALQAAARPRRPSRTASFFVELAPIGDPALVARRSPTRSASSERRSGRRQAL